jgi:hypothetical protein
MRTPKSEAAHGWDREECLQEEDSMSSPITPLQRAAHQVFPSGAAEPPGAPQSTTAPEGATAPFAFELTASLDTLRPSAPYDDVIPSSPPQEVLDEMASAAQTHAALSAQGRELRFSHDEQSGRTRIEVRDRGGNVLRTLSPAEALEVAAGAPLE